MAWAQSGGDFSAGLSLFLSYYRNIFYVRNIEIKGVARGMATLVSEFSNKTKMGAKEIWALVETGRAGMQTGCFAPLAMTKGEIVITKETTALNGLLLRRQTDRNDKKLREEFPFLGRKDCPDELAVTVNKMLTAYDDYRTNRELLFDVDLNDSEACYRAARLVVDAHIQNQECWKELNYYKIHGKVLGQMPQFKKKVLRKKLSGMSTVVLVKTAHNNIPRKLSYYKSQMNKGGNQKLDVLRQRVTEAEEELNMIEEILRERGEL
jgi:hypothetical protein